MLFGLTNRLLKHFVSRISSPMKRIDQFFERHSPAKYSRVDSPTIKENHPAEFDDNVKNDHAIISEDQKMRMELNKAQAIAKREEKSKVGQQNTSTVNKQGASSVSESSIKDTFALEHRTMGAEWLKILESEFSKPYFLNLKGFLSTEQASKQAIYPPEGDIYSWSRLTPPENVKVVILGQDPYHGPGQAHGLCFSVKKGIAPPPSLLNIFTELKNNFPDFERPSHGCLEKWATQGVLLLNATLTVRASQPASHANKGWETFTDAVIRHLNKEHEHLVFILWGSYAQKKGSTIDQTRHLVLSSAHPSPLSSHRGFFNQSQFKRANEYLMKNVKTPVNWSDV